MITDFYDKVVIKIEYEGFYGSGILISNTQKTNSYLITAWHCLNEQTDIAYEKIKIFRQVEGCIKEIFLNFREKTILKENDIIIFTIDFLDDIPEYQIIEPEIREPCLCTESKNFQSAANGKNHCLCTGASL